MHWNRIVPLAGCVAIVAAAAGCEKSSVENRQGAKLTLVAPANQTLTRGERNKILVAVSRNDVTGPIDVRFEGLPMGVTVLESPAQIPADDSTSNFTLVAAPDAVLVKEHMATVTATARGAGDGMSVSERFKIDVLEGKIEAR